MRANEIYLKLAQLRRRDHDIGQRAEACVDSVDYFIALDYLLYETAGAQDALVG